MRSVKNIDVFVGIKAEQSLRDSVRLHMEHTENDLELVPVGKKDWIAGIRVRAIPSQRQLEDICRKVHRSLLSLGSEQRIRDENIRLYPIPEPVPVFREPDTVSAPESNPTSPPSDHPEASNCPLCQRVVHEYNLHYDTTGRIVGCFMCGGFRNRH